MREKLNVNRTTVLLVTGIAGAICMAASDWLMIYGDTSFKGNLPWLTEGVARISPEVNGFAMLLAFPAVIFYIAGLAGAGKIIREKAKEKTYSVLMCIGLTPWIAIHLFYTMILFIFSWMINNGNEELAYTLSEEVFNHFMWIIPIGELFMVLPFIYLFIVIVTGYTFLKNGKAFNNPLIIFIVLKGITFLMPDIPAKLAFTNGLMSESMIIWFVLLIFMVRNKKRDSKCWYIS